MQLFSVIGKEPLTFNQFKTIGVNILAPFINQLELCHAMNEDGTRNL